MFWENIKEAVTSISSNKMRSLLTMLGIIIGISSVIIITTIGGSIQSTLTATMNSLGGNMVQAYVEARYPENDEDWATWEQPEMTDSDYVTQDMIDGLIEKYPDEVTGVAAQNYLGSGTIKDDAGFGCPARNRAICPDSCSVPPSCTAARHSSGPNQSSRPSTPDLSHTMRRRIDHRPAESDKEVRCRKENGSARRTASVAGSTGRFR